MNVRQPLPPRNSNVFTITEQSTSIKASVNLKGSKYLKLLQDARLNSQWQQVPELARKTDKHADQRSCLTITATVEAQIASAYRNGPPANREKADNAAEDALAVLAQAIEQEVIYPEDSFEARVCIQDIHHNLCNWDAVVGNIQKEIEQELEDISRKSSELSPYLRICVLKSKFCIANALENRHQYDEARDVYQATISYINTVPTAVAVLPEARFWIVRILAKSCALDMQDFDPGNTEHAMSALKAFRTWSSFWATQSSWTSGDLDPAGPETRRRIWGLYYHLLSTLLEVSKDETPTYIKRSVGSDATATRVEFFDSRLAQKHELHHVEHAYEAILLSETNFPDACQDNRQIELWTTQLMVNWRILTGIYWREADLGPGGKIGLGRDVLEMLYRAAAKTFQSTAILRYLFQCHAALTDFNIAIKAFDSYIDIVKRARARAKKTGKNELGLDSEDTIFYTAADCINLLCSYGAREEAEKALDIAALIKGWLEAEPLLPPSTSLASPASNYPATPVSKFTSATNMAQAAAYRAIGQCKAHWASLTYDPAARSTLLTQARASLETAIELQKPAEPEIETVKHITMVLTELGDIAGAVRMLKSLLMANVQNASEGVRLQVDVVAEQCRLLPLWHHLVLLLTAKEEYETALSTCNLALSTYIDALEGSNRPDPVGDGLVLRKPENSSLSALDVYTDQDKSNLLQLKLTELELVVDLEGAVAAVASISEPLSLYARLFGVSTTPEKRLDTASTQNNLPSKSSLATLKKSFRNSILGRPKASAPSLIGRTIAEQSSDTASTLGENYQASSPTSPKSMSKETLSSRPHTSFGLGGILHKSHQNRSSAPLSTENLRGDMASMAIAPEFSTKPASQVVSNAPKSPDPSNSKTSKRVFSRKSNKATPDTTTEQTDAPDVIDLEAPRTKPTLTVVKTLSVPQFAPEVRQRHAQMVLINIWLFVASIYARDDLRENQDEAIEEAARLVEGINNKVVQTQPSARTFDDRGWGWGKSTGRLWADVLYERGQLAVSTGRSHDALIAFDCALDSLPDHVGATLGLSNLLLDIYEQKVPAEPPSSNSLRQTAEEVQVHARVHSERPFAEAVHATVDSVPKTNGLADGTDKTGNNADTDVGSRIEEAPREATPAELNRIAARARATGLLSSMTKLGEGWADSEVWYVLARAYELNGQFERAKECLWWVIRLEDTKPLRPWRVCSGNSWW